MNRFNKLLLLVLLTIFLGCTHRVVKPVERRPPQPQAAPAPLVPEERLERKIRSLEKLASDQGLSSPQRAMAKRLLESYRSVQDTAPLSMAGTRERAVVEELLDSLDLVEGSFFTKTPALGPLPLAAYLEKRNEILKSYSTGNYARAIQLCQKLETDYGAEALRGKVGMAYVLSLARNDMSEDALGAVKKLKELDGIEPDQALLEAKIAEWQLKLGFPDKAEAIYGDMSRSVSARGKLLEVLGKQIEESRRVAAEQPPGATDSSVGSVLAQVPEKIKEGRFDEAREMLLLARRGVSSDSDAASVDRSLAEVDAAEEKYLNERIAGITKKKDAIETTRDLLEKEKYGEAVTGIEALEAEQGQGPEIAALKEQAVEKFIQEERNRAAKMFLMARQTEDKKKKAEYLRGSLNILKNLVEKYPSSTLITKINSNIKSVEDEMTRLGIH